MKKRRKLYSLRIKNWHCPSKISLQENSLFLLGVLKKTTRPAPTLHQLFLGKSEEAESLLQPSLLSLPNVGGLKDCGTTMSTPPLCPR
ncbi:costars family protein ABRACL isoform X1 [Canis lupus familiaris]|uniref:costars family protein ABRACL isoform X1 n=1 Tax=Canis lupus familiaris TaxID=9615 RepID=UPI0018F297EE|nr:costars family protein ABRACL isoform X1 [Canis lupus familiaris]XP_038382109.1 costars family protein ABRACL isoform X1 [Canis lupus familiaris]